MKGTQDFMTATANPILEVPTDCVCVRCSNYAAPGALTNSPLPPIATTTTTIIQQLLADIARVRPANAKRFAIRELSGKSKPADDAEEAAPDVVAK